MICPHCNTPVVKIPVNWKCPHCNEKLPEPGFWQRYFEGLSEFLQDKSFIFWGVLLAIVLIVVAVAEAFLGEARMLTYFGKNFLFSMIMIFYAGMLIDLYMRIVLPLEVIGGSTFILRERKVIRNMRKASHVALLAGVITGLIHAGPVMFFEMFPSYIVIISVYLALAWAISGIFLDPKMVEDVRFRYFIDRLGVTSLKKLRRVSVITITGIFIATIGYIILLQVPGLWHEIQNWTFVGGAIRFVQAYLGWLL